MPLVGIYKFRVKTCLESELKTNWIHFAREFTPKAGFWSLPERTFVVNLQPKRIYGASRGAFTSWIHVQNEFSEPPGAHFPHEFTSKTNSLFFRTYFFGFWPPCKKISISLVNGLSPLPFPGVLVSPPLVGRPLQDWVLFKVSGLTHFARAFTPKTGFWSLPGRTFGMYVCMYVY